MIKYDITSYRLTKTELFYLNNFIKIYSRKIDFTNRLPEIYFGNFLDFFHGDNVSDQIHPKEEDLFSDDILSSISSPDYLGFYEYPDGYEGKVYLYKDRIKELAIRYSITYNKDYKVCFDAILFIVLFHELGHWVTHWLLKSSTDKKAYIFTNLDTEIKETMAQLNVLYVLKGYNNKLVNEIRDVFFNLVKRQPTPYQVFIETKGTKDKKGYFSPSITTLNRFIKLLEIKTTMDLHDDFEFLLTGKNKL